MSRFTAAAVHRRRWWILAVLCVSLFVVTLDNTVLNVAIPSLVGELSLSSGQTQWVVDAYSIVFAGLLMTAGALSDRFGRRRGLLLGLTVFGAASVVAAFSPSAPLLIVARALMGVGGAFLMPGTLSIVVNVFDETERPKAIGFWGAVSGLGLVAGPLIGGTLVEHFWWGSVFLINVPIVAAAIIAVLILVPESRRADAVRIDFIGAFLASTAIVATVWAVIGIPDHGWWSLPTATAAVVAAAAATAFARWELRTAHPMLDLTLLRNPRFTGVCLTGMVLMCTIGGTTFVLTQYLQLVVGLTPIGAGLCMLPVAASIGVAAPLAPRVVAAIGESSTIALGMLGVAAGLGTLAISARIDSMPLLLVACAMAGAGLGTAFAPASDALMSTMPRESAGVASALNDMLQEIGAALGVAVIGSILTAGYRALVPAGAPSDLHSLVTVDDEATRAALQDAFGAAFGRAELVAVVVMAAGALLVWGLLRRGERRTLEVRDMSPEMV